LDNQIGFPPFFSEEPSETYKKIINWENYFEIPTDSKISRAAEDLIRKLIADRRQRLGINGVQEIKAHPFFSGVNWSNIRSMTPPFKPEVN
jgi:serine/threonine kinase 38